MLQSAKLYSKSIYGRIFPLDSFRRFVADQLLQTSYNFGYYGGLSIAVTVSILSILYFLGSTAERYMGPVMLNSEHYIISGIFAGIITALLLSIVTGCLVLMGYTIYKEDYLPWVKQQQDQHLNASPWKYLLPRIAYTVGGIIAFVIYAIVSTKGFEVIVGTPRTCPPRSQRVKFSETKPPCIEEDLPALIIFLVSVLLQAALYVMLCSMYFLYEYFRSSCCDAYAKHVRRASSAVSKRDDAKPEEIRVVLR